MRRLLFVSILLSGTASFAEPSPKVIPILPAFVGSYFNCVRNLGTNHPECVKLLKGLNKMVGNEVPDELTNGEEK